MIALTVFFKGLGKAWRQGTGPIGLSSLPNWSVPSLLPCFLPGVACWNPDHLPPSWWGPLTAPVQRSGGMGQDLGLSVSDVPSGPASAWKGFLSLDQGALTFLEWCRILSKGGPGGWGTMGGLRSASWPGLGPGFGGVLGTWGHWPTLPVPSSINGSPQTPGGLDPKAPSISRLTDPGIVGGGMGGSLKVVYRCTCGRTRVAAADLVLQEGLGHSCPLWFFQCQVGLCVPCKGSDSGHGPGDRHKPPTLTVEPRWYL